MPDNDERYAIGDELVLLRGPWAGSRVVIIDVDMRPYRATAELVGLTPTFFYSIREIGTRASTRWATLAQLDNWTVGA